MIENCGQYSSTTGTSKVFLAQVSTYIPQVDVDKVLQFHGIRWSRGHLYAIDYRTFKCRWKYHAHTAKTITKKIKTTNDV